MKKTTLILILTMSFFNKSQAKEYNRIIDENYNWKLVQIYDPISNKTSAYVADGISEDKYMYIDSNENRYKMHITLMCDIENNKFERILYSGSVNSFPNSDSPSSNVTYKIGDGEILNTVMKKYSSRRIIMDDSMFSNLSKATSGDLFIQFDGESGYILRLSTGLEIIKKISSICSGVPVSTSFD